MADEIRCEVIPVQFLDTQNVFDEKYRQGVGHRRAHGRGGKDDQQEDVRPVRQDIAQAFSKFDAFFRGLVDRVFGDCDERNRGRDRHEYAESNDQYRHGVDWFGVQPHNSYERDGSERSNECSADAKKFPPTPDERAFVVVAREFRSPGGKG